MENKKKFSKANLLYFFSMFLGVAIIVMGFSVANNAKKELEKQQEIAQSAEENVVKKEKTEEVAKVAEKIEKEAESEPETVILTAAKPEKADEFAPKLENCVITKPAEGKITVPFTGKTLVYSDYYDDWSIHKGIDISAKGSSQVKAAANGTIKEVYNDSRLGIVIILQHVNFTTVYGNLTTDSLVKVGDNVYAGDIISGVGKSADGKEFLHFELNYKGEDIDPEPLFG